MTYAPKNSIKPLTNEQKALARKLKISDAFLMLLATRGYEREEDIVKFLRPTIGDFSSPFDIAGMKEATIRLQRAIKNKERVLIYGDYDCDGICAIAILMLYLKGKVDASYFIPDRNKDGYGISVDALKGIIARKKPQLVITVDCGITAANEVEYLKSQGIDTIVTDHHEPQAQIPDCIVVDPKVQKTGYYDFCGAGVALKLVEAMAGREEATKYLDICAIATIADVVPLTKDNRVIAYLGLKEIASNPRKGIKMMLGDDKATSQNIMFRLAPRMNAAGRLGSAMKVVSLFLENDYFMLKTLSEELSRDNAHRQELCEKAVEEAKAMLKNVDFNETNIIVLESERWEAGILGIAAARLVDEFKRPTVLFARSGDELKGSARSVPSVNIFELFTALSSYFTAFGGHAQAAGVSMNCDAFEDFKNAANELLSTRPSSDFRPAVEYDMLLNLNGDILSFAKELALLEPTGYGNPKPNFLVNVKNFKFDKIGFSNHMKYSAKSMDLMAFSRYDHTLAPRIESADFEISLGLNTFQNNTVAQGIVQSLKIRDLKLTDDECKTYNLHHLDYEGEIQLESVGVADIERMLEKPFGTLVACFDWSGFERIRNASEKVAKLSFDFADSPHLNPENRIILCPSPDFDFRFFERVIFVGHPLTEGYKAHVASIVKTCSFEDASAKRLSLSDATLRAAYKFMYELSASKSRVQSMSRFYSYVASRTSITEIEFFVAVKIFEQLGLLKIGDRGMIEVSRRNVELRNSVAYRNLSH